MRGRGEDLPAFLVKKVKIENIIRNKGSVLKKTISALLIFVLLSSNIAFAKASSSSRCGSCIKKIAVAATVIYVLKKDNTNDKKELVKSEKAKGQKSIDYCENEDGEEIDCDDLE